MDSLAKTWPQDERVFVSNDESFVAGVFYKPGKRGILVPNTLGPELDSYLRTFNGAAYDEIFSEKPPREHSFHIKFRGDTPASAQNAEIGNHGTQLTQSYPAPLLADVLNRSAFYARISGQKKVHVSAIKSYAPGEYTKDNFSENDGFHHDGYEESPANIEPTMIVTYAGKKEIGTQWIPQDLDEASRKDIVTHQTDIEYLKTQWNMQSAPLGWGFMIQSLSRSTPKDEGNFHRTGLLFDDESHRLSFMFG